MQGSWGLVERGSGGLAPGRPRSGGDDGVPQPAAVGSSGGSTTSAAEAEAVGDRTLETSGGWDDAASDGSRGRVGGGVETVIWRRLGGDGGGDDRLGNSGVGEVAEGDIVRWWAGEEESLRVGGFSEKEYQRERGRERKREGRNRERDRFGRDGGRDEGEGVETRERDVRGEVERRRETVIGEGDEGDMERRTEAVLEGGRGGRPCRRGGAGAGRRRLQATERVGEGRGERGRGKRERESGGKTKTEGNF